MRAPNEPAKRGGRMDRDAYFNAAFKILGTEGFQNLNADNLCAELGVTRGSFYHHFAGWPEFVEALMAVWERTLGDLLGEWTAADPVQCLADVVAVLDQWPAQAESAIRAWGWADPTVAATARRWDLAREEAARAMFTAFIDDPERARVLAHMNTAITTGMLVLQRPVDLDLAMKVIGEFMRGVVGIEIVPDGAGGFAPRFPPDWSPRGWYGGSTDMWPGAPAQAERSVPTVAAHASGKRGARADREAYFNAALKILGTVGFQDIGVDALCAELGVTRGSFYHHFAGWPEFVDDLMETWERTVADLLARWVAMDPMDASADVLASLTRYPLQAESAIRAWGWANPRVAAAARRWDLTREDASRVFLEIFTGDAERARVLAHMGTALFVGMLNLQRPIDLDLFVKALAETWPVVLDVEIAPDGAGGFVPRFPTAEID